MSDDFVKSADRVLTLIELLNSGRDMSHTQLSELSLIPKSSLSQLLKTLVARGWVAFSHGSKTYSIGKAVVALARHSGTLDNIMAAAPNVLRQLTRVTNEGSALNIRKGDYMEVAVAEPSPMRLAPFMQLGDRAPLYATSGGKVILAFLHKDQIEAYVKRVRFEAITSLTVKSKSALMDELRKIKSSGVAYSFEEFTPGVVGIAKAVIGPSGNVIASVKVALPVLRYSKKTDQMIRRHMELAVHKLSMLAGNAESL